VDGSDSAPGTRDRAEDSWARIAAAAEQLGLEAASRATHRADAELAGSDESTALVLERLRTARAPEDALGAFETVETIGRGGMGVVVRARQPALERDVALKRLNRPTEALSAAFVSEAQIMGRLEHANIPPVHTLVRDPSGDTVLAMKLVRGASWTDLIQRGHLPLADHLRVLAGVTNAVAFAHSRGVIHRDIKPDNVMVGDYGQVYLMDWGIAAAIDLQVSAASAILHVSDMPGPLGTPRYMPPELARGRAEEQDARTDVYLLGACLHEVLTGRPLHPGETMAEIRASALLSEPPPFDSDVPRELAELCRGATARQPAERLPTALAFGAALQAYLEHREALALVASAAALVAQLGRTPDASDRIYHEASFAYRRALEIWPGADEARIGLAALHELMLERAVGAEDLPLARRVVAELAEPAASHRRAVADLEARLARRSRELAGLRAAEKRRDWQAIAKPVSAIFLVAATAGGIASAFTRAVLGNPYAVLGIWLGVCAVAGGYARLRLARVAIPDTLAAPRVFWIWASVASGIALHGAVEMVHGTTPFSQTHVVSFMLGIGFVATAVQTRRWMLLPALVWFAGGIFCGLWRGYLIEVFGILWVITLGGVGVALLLGARLDEPDAAALPKSTR
jgi:tRNA A-37 threonylcarbamoyl transferase component Bud32